MRKINLSFLTLKWISDLRPTTILLLWSVAALLEGVTAALFLINIPSDSNNVWLFGLSKGRVFVLGGMLGLIFTNGFLAYQFGRNSLLGKRMTGFIQNLVKKSLIYGGLVGSSLFGVFLFSQVIHLARVVSDPYVRGYLVRLIPLVFWLLAICIQNLLLLPLMRHGANGSGEIFSGGILRSSGIIFVFLLVLGIGVVISGIGIEPDKIGWDAPGVPILPLQVGLIWGLAAVLLLLESWLRTRETSNKVKIIADLLLSVLIWGFAFTLWAREPLTPDFFAPEPRPPNYEIYPHSDAALHDSTAQHLLIGEGFPGVARKPLFALFLAFLHGIAGQDYMDVIILQVAVLAFLPVFIYWLAKILHHRVSGWIAAGIIILRERNAIALSGEIGVSHAKLMMSDLPAALAIVILTLLIVLWLKDPKKRPLLPLGIGASIGTFLLLRPQFVLLIPAVILLLIVFLKRPLWGFVNFGLITLGIFLTLSPWLWRSYTLTGKFTLNDPDQMAFLTHQYQLEPGADIIPRYPDEPEAAFIKRNNDYVKEFTLEHPGVVARFIASHFTHNKVEMFQALPVTFWYVQNPDSDLFPYWRQQWSKLWEDCCSIHAYVNAVGYWDPLRADIKPYQLPAMVLNLVLISLGLGVMWIRQDIIGWIPLGVSLFYSLSTAVGRYSGWRLILPADWVVYLYFAIGIGQITIWLRMIYTGQSEFKSPETSKTSTWQRINASPGNFEYSIRSGVVLCVILLGIGMVPLIVEFAIPERYAVTPEKDLITKVSEFTDMEIQSFLDHENAVVIQGRALYPRFYKAGIGEPGNGWPAFSSRDFDRFTLIVILDSQNSNVILPMEEPPEYFPHASDVVVVGCRKGDYIDAAIVKLLGDGDHTLVRSSLTSLACPLLSP